MKDTFTPPIKSRSTEELLQIVGASHKWNPDAVHIAKYELANRNVTSEMVATATHNEKEREMREKERKANESFDLIDFTIKFRSTLLLILFSWELKKDGFDTKARQQRIIRPIIIGIAIAVFVLSYL